MISHRDLGKIRDNWRKPGRENPRFTRRIFSDGEVIDVAEDIRDKGIGEQPIRLTRQIIGRGMASDVGFLKLGSHVEKKNISKMEIGVVLRENKGGVVRT